jgi:hypothetical protein
MGAKMKWRQGFFRLWIFGSALFVIAVAAVNYNEIKAQFNAIGLQKFELMPVLCAKARGLEGTDFQRVGEGDWDCFCPLSKFRTLYPEYKDLSDKDLSSKLYAKRGFPVHDLKNPWITVLTDIGFALGIPLIVLILGAALAWVFSGFKASAGTAPGDYR